MSFQVGQTLQATLYVRKAGALVDPTTVTLELQRPDGTTVTPSPAKQSTGLYAATFVVDQPGRWLFLWTTVGNGADGIKQSWFGPVVTREL